jgi:hypothetical protein
MNIISIHLGRPLDKRGVTLSGCLARSTIVAALGGLLFGFDTAVIAGVTHALRETYWTADCSIRSTRRANTIRGESPSRVELCMCCASVAMVPIQARTPSVRKS